MKSNYLLLSLALLLLWGACKEAKSAQENPVVTGEESTLRIPADLVMAYGSGEVKMCRYRDQTVYQCGRNAPDAGTEIFDDTGKKIGGCYYSTDNVDQICRELTQCRVIYRAFPNIWGLPKVEYAEY